MANKQPDERQDPIERFDGWLYRLEVREVDGRGFTAQAEIAADPKGDLVGQLVGSSDLVLVTREVALEVAGDLARAWIRANGSP